MEENSTTNFNSNDTLYGSLDWEEYVPHPCPEISYTTTAFYGVCLAISLCGLAGNGVVMWFLGFQTKQSPFNVYILNLTVADFSLLLLILLILSVFLAREKLCVSLFPSSNQYWNFMAVFAFLFHLFYLSSLGLLTALSVERCVSVLCPIWFRCHRPRQLTGIVSGALWALSVVFFLSFYVTYIITGWSNNFISIIAFAISMVFSLLMLVSNLFLFLKLRCGSQRRQPGRLFVAILLNVLVFLALSVPFSWYVSTTMTYFAQIYPGDYYVLLAVLNSSLNPVIYVLVGSWQRRRFHLSIRVALRRVFEEKARSDEGSHGPGDTVVEMTAL